MASIYSYHCVCSQYLLCSTVELALSPTRKESEDKAYILPLNLIRDETSEHQPGSIVQLQTVSDRKPLLVRRLDGFEYRYEQRCPRCKLSIGYHLDATQFDSSNSPGSKTDVIYILPGSIITTQDIKEKI
jgi:hypothetical protein